MPDLKVPDWFDADWYAEQKAVQMNAVNYPGLPDGATEWTAALYKQYLESWRDADGNPVPGASIGEKSYQNFLACNAESYKDAPAGLGFDDINISGSKFFNIPVYLENLAQFNNANPDADPTPAPEGGWTAANEMTAIFETFDSSVWGHFVTTWDKWLDVNPSNDFNLREYVRLRAEAMGEGTTEAEAIAAIKQDSGDPFQDFATWGKANGITTAPIVELPTTPPANFNPWNPAGTPPAGEDDPYDQNYKDENILPGEYSYTGENGQNTHFVAKYGANVADRTLNAKDVITGGENALNSLVVDLGANWKGFNEVKGETVFDGADAVTHVGRIVLNHEEAVAGKSFTFDAKNISEDTVQYDIHNAGAGVISLDGLTKAVETVNISGIKTVPSGETQAATKLDFESGATKGTNDLTLGIEDVCVDGGSAGIEFAGIENVTIDSNGDAANRIDLAKATGITNLTVTGDAGLTIANTSSSTIKSFDASAATQAVNFGVDNLASRAVIKGGAGSDTITFMGAANVGKADWTSIENLTFHKGGAVNAKGVEGIESIWIAGTADTTVRNLVADRISISQSATGTDVDQTAVNGEIGDVNFITQGGADGKAIKANVKSDNTGNVNIEVGGKDTIADASCFEFDKAEGTITINIDNAANEGKADPAVTLTAQKATELKADIAGGFTLSNNSKLDSIENVDVTLTNAHPKADSFNTFKLSAMKSAQEVTINAGGEKVGLDALGNDKGNAVTISIQDAQEVSLDAIATGNASSITANIEAVGDVGSKTAAITAGSGSDIDLTISTEQDGDNSGSVLFKNIQGDDLNLNFSNVGGGVYAEMKSDGKFVATELSASGAINYIGADTSVTGNGSAYVGVDAIKITKVGAGSTSTIQLGDGADQLEVGALKLGDEKEATIRVDLGDDELVDTLTVNASTKGNLTVRVMDFSKGEADEDGKYNDSDVIKYDKSSTVVGASETDAANKANAINTALETFDDGFEIAKEDIKGNVFVHGGNVYAMLSSGTGDNIAYTLIEVVGAATDLGEDGGGVISASA